MRKSKYYIGVLILVVLAAGFCGGGMGEHSSSAAGDSTGSTMETETILYLDFESGRMGNWRQGFMFSSKHLDMEIVPSTKHNSSEGILHIQPMEGEESGAACYLLEDNGGKPVPLTPDIHIACSWNVSRVVGTNGLWFGLRTREKESGKINNSARLVNYVQNKHRYIRVYNDRASAWFYHAAEVYDFMERQYGPMQPGDFVIEGIYLGFSQCKGVEAWVDNFWLGRGEPPDSINQITLTDPSAMAEGSRMNGFSYAYINNDYIPDRIEVWHERAEIFINPHSRAAETGNSRTEGSIVYGESEPDMTIRFDRQRDSGVVTAADLDGDGYSDLLFHFDDDKGNACYRNDYIRGRMIDVTSSIGPLKFEGQQSSGSAVADTDGDTDMDVLLFNAFIRRGTGFGGVRFFRNKGDFRFSCCLEESGIIPQGSYGGAFSDFDGNGTQDLFINYRPSRTNHGCFINLNAGMGKFRLPREVLTAPANIHFRGFAVADFDNDADCDLYCVSNYIVDFKEIPLDAAAPRTMLFRNNGSGEFTDVTEDCGACYRGRASDALAGDFDQDGLVDIYLIRGEKPCIFYHNRGDNTFRESERFTDLMCDVPVVRGTALDIDADGDLDLVLLRKDGEGVVIRENLGSPDNFLQVVLRGKGGNYYGIGGKVSIYQAGFLNDENHLLGYREIRHGTGVATYAPPVAHFGLEEAGAVDLKVVFPPHGGRKPVTVIRENVPRGSFITVSEYRSLAGRIIHSRKLERIRDSFLIAVFRVPAWLFALGAVVVISWGGIFIKDARHRGIPAGLKVIILVFTISVSALLLYRSLLWGLPALALCGLVTGFSYRLENLLNKFTTSLSRREKMEEMLLDDLSQAIHTEKKFAFLEGMARDENILLNLTGEEVEEDFDNLYNIISLMRISDAADPAWRQARERVNKLKKICGRVMDGEGHFSESSLREFGKRLSGLQNILHSYRQKLRLKYSISFRNEWEGLKAGYRRRLRREGVELEDRFSEEARKIRVHLLRDEFRHIFKNLMDNSIWALEQAEEKKITLEGYPEGKHLVVRWRDTGRGISDRLSEELFSSPVESSRPGGSGEGLYQSRKILNRRGGLIRYEKPSQGRGTVFVIKMIRISTQGD